MAKIVLAGPPRSGKSCLREGLKQAIRTVPGSPYPYFITGCPDGEGAWFQATVNRDPAAARACKEAYKAKFTPEFVHRVAESVANCPLPLTLVDIGGVPSEENHEICASATHIVILFPLSMDPDSFRELQERYKSCGLKVPQDLQEAVASWREFAQALGLAVVAEIVSDYDGQADTVHGLGQDGVFRGSVHYLERGVDASQRPAVKALADHLVSLAG